MSNQELLSRIYNELLKLNNKVNNLIKIWAKGLNRDLRKEDIQKTVNCMEWFSTSFVFREIKIKTTKRYHYTSIAMAKIQNTDTTKVLIRMWSILLCCWCNIKTVQPLWNTVWCVPAKLLQSCPTLWEWTVACQAPLSMEFSRQEYCSGLTCPPLRGLPDPGIKLTSLMSPALAGRFFIISATWGPLNMLLSCNPAIILLGI